MPTEVQDFTPPSAKSDRVLSIDALRGFDMFWIIGGDEIASAIMKLNKNSIAQSVLVQVSDHVEWAGFRFYDMIFPLFLFIIGATLPFSVGRRLDDGAHKGEIARKVLARAAILILFGLIYNGILDFHGWDHVRFFGVLQRQGFGYGAAALIFIYSKPKIQIAIFAAVLIGYWALMAFAPVPHVGHGDFSQWGNFANYIDRGMLLRGQMYEKYGDPEGLISMIPSICTALLGLFAGQWLKSKRSESHKVLGLASGGVLSIGLGLAWSPWFPIIKKIWTSSYVLVAGGCSLLLLALFYWIIDVMEWKKWCFPFVVIGMNSITIYMTARIMRFGDISQFFLGGLIRVLPKEKDLILSIGVLVAEWIFLYFLFRKKIFLRV